MPPFSHHLVAKKKEDATIFVLAHHFAYNPLEKRLQLMGHGRDCD